MLFDVLSKDSSYFTGDFVEISLCSKKEPSQRFSSNADGGTRTHTSIRTTDFESVSSPPVPTHRLIQLFDLKYIIILNHNVNNSFIKIMKIKFNPILKGKGSEGSLWIKCNKR